MLKPDFLSQNSSLIRLHQTSPKYEKKQCKMVQTRISDIPVKNFEKKFFSKKFDFVTSNFHFRASKNSSWLDYIKQARNMWKNFAKWSKKCSQTFSWKNLKKNFFKKFSIFWLQIFTFERRSELQFSTLPPKYRLCNEFVCVLPRSRNFLLTNFGCM